MTATTVWFASYPKSGNTWLRALVSGVLEGGEVRLPDVVRKFADMSQGTIFTEFGLTPSVLDDRQAHALVTASTEAQAERSEGMLFRKSHSAFGAPDDVSRTQHRLTTETKALYVVRDPRAIVVSLSHHLGVDIRQAMLIMRDGVVMDLPEEIDDRYLVGGPRVVADWGSWSENVESWLDQGDVPVLVVKYEDLVANPRDVLVKVVTWLGIPARDEVLDEAVEQSSFDRLAVQEALTGFAEAVAPNRAFFRKGAADAWKDELEPELADEVARDHGTVMRRLGYL